MQFLFRLLYRKASEDLAVSRKNFNRHEAFTNLPVGPQHRFRQLLFASASYGRLVAADQYSPVQVETWQLDILGPEQPDEIEFVFEIAGKELDPFLVLSLIHI